MENLTEAQKADMEAPQEDINPQLSGNPGQLAPGERDGRVSRMKALLVEVAETLSQNIVREDAKGKGWEIGAEMAVLVPWSELHLVFTYIRRLGIAIDEAQPGDKGAREFPKGPLRDDVLMVDALFQTLPSDEVEIEKGAWDRLRLMIPKSPAPMDTAPAPTIEKAAREYAEAYREWHEDASLFPSDEMLGASTDLLKAIGLELVENEDGGKFELCPLPPIPKPLDKEAGKP